MIGLCLRWLSATLSARHDLRMTSCKNIAENVDVRGPSKQAATTGEATDGTGAPAVMLDRRQRGAAGAFLAAAPAQRWVRPDGIGPHHHH